MWTSVHHLILLQAYFRTESRNAFGIEKRSVIEITYPSRHRVLFMQSDNVDIVEEEESTMYISCLIPFYGTPLRSSVNIQSQERDDHGIGLLIENDHLGASQVDPENASFRAELLRSAL